MNKGHNKQCFFFTGLCVLVVLGLVYYFFFASFSKSGEVQYVYIDTNDNADSVYHKLEPFGTEHGIWIFQTLARHSSLKNGVLTGRFKVAPGEGTLSVFRKIKNGVQEPVKLVIPSVRTVEKLCGTLSSKLMLDSATLQKSLTDASVCKKYGQSPETMVCMFIPNTYDVYWNTSIDNLLERMKQESDRFWNPERLQKAAACGLSKEQVITLASIVDEETANDEEKPMVAQMYLNRLHLRNGEYPNGMPLQADPTIKFALKQFALKRIYTNMLSVNSPYNTYKNTGLPPGPIRIPTVRGIDAVLNHANHDYIYMCAKEDFSGTHNFARTYAEHLQNAAKYAKALNERGIK